jgi:hypothetical protein
MIVDAAVSSCRRRNSIEVWSRYDPLESKGRLGRASHGPAGSKSAHVHAINVHVNAPRSREAHLEAADASFAWPRHREEFPGLAVCCSARNDQFHNISVPGNALL